MSEFVVRNGLIVSGSTYLEAISQSNEAYILSYDSVTNEVFYQSTASLVPSTASFAITASFALNVPATASTAISASFAATASSADAFYVRGSVGIGTASPANKLEVNSGTSAGVFRALSSNATSLRAFYEATAGNVEQHFLYTGNQDWVLGLDKADSNKFKLASADDGFASAKVTVTTGGNVGIGTTNPQAKLDVNGDGRFTGGLNLTSENPQLTFTDTTAGQDDMVLSMNGDYLEFLSNALRNIITVHGETSTYTGNVGIGLTNPSHKLSVLGAVSASSFTGSFSGTTTNAISASFAATASSADAFYVRGNVGIGTSNPQYKLDVNGSFRVDGTNGDFIVDSTGNDIYFTRNDANYFIANQANSSINFLLGAGLSQSLHLKNNGNVGINNVNPTAKLDVTGNSKFLATFSSYTADGLFGDTALPGVYVNTPGGTSRGTYLGYRDFGGGQYYGRIGVSGSVAWSLGIGNSAGNNFSIGLNNDTATDYLTVLSGSGNVGIGTTNPLYKLHVVGSTYVNSGTLFVDSGEYIRWGNSAQGIRGVNDTSLEFVVGSSTRMYVSSSGFVGIGTTAPSAPLVVQSSIYDAPGANNKGALQIAFNNTNGLSFGTYNAVPYGNYIQSLDHTQGGITTYPLLLNPTGGNIGIGTTNPLSILQVNKSSQAYTSPTASGALVLSDTAGTGAVLDMGVNTTYLSYIQSRYLDSTQAYQLLLNPGGGSVGIGLTNPSHKLTVLGAVSASSFTGSFSGTIAAPGATTQVAFNSGGTLSADSGFVYSGSRVGIGLATPGAKLDIVSTEAGSEGLRVDGSGGGFAFVVRGGTTYTTHIRAGATIGANYFSTPPANGLIVEGSVGIGTSSPSQTLHVYTAGATPILLERSASNANVSAQFKDQTSSWYIGKASNGYFAIGEEANLGNVTIFNITTGGNVGIGTNSPTHKLTVLGAVSASSFTGSFSGTASNAISASFAATASSADAFYVRGNVGIGVTNPNGNLQVNNGTNLNIAFNNTTLDATTTSRISSVNDAVSAGVGLVIQGSPLAFTNNGGETMRITTGGNVGIGTTNPDQYGFAGKLLTVNGGASYTNLILAGDTNSGIAFGTSTTRLGQITMEGTNGMTFYSTGSATGLTMTLSRSGNVGIGTTNPGAKLRVEGLVSVDGEGNGILVDTGTVAGARVGLMKYGGYEGMLIAGNATLLRLGHRTDTAAVFGGTPTIREDLVITASGSVGIGTNNPTYKLVVDGDSSEGAIGIERTTVSSNTVIGAVNFTNNNAGTVYGRVRGGRNTAGDGYVSLGTGLGDNLYAIEGGNVGIGLSAPAYKLHVSGGNSYMDGNLTVTGAITAQELYVQYISSSIIYSTGSNKFGDQTSDIQYFTGSLLLSGSFSAVSDTSYFSGNVGIGTASPAQKLQVQNGNVGLYSDSYGNTGLLRHYGTDSAEKYQQGLTTGGDFYQYTFAGLNHIFYTNNGSERMRITSGGNVGIGTTSPSHKLQVSGSIALNTVTDGTSRYFTYPDVNHSWYYDDNIVGSSADVMTYYENFLVRHQDTTNVFLINGSGSVGIGTTNPGDKLDILGSGAQFLRIANVGTYLMRFGIDASNDGYIGSSNATPIGFHTNGVNRMHITTAGYVGIGTTNPTQYSTLFPAQLAVNASSTVDGIFSTTDNSSAAELVLFKKSTTNDFGSLLIQHSGSSGRAIEVNYGVNMATGVGGTTSYFVNTNGSGYYAGNVGIGTTSPSNTLEVLGSATIRNSNGGGALNIGTNSGRTEYQYITLGGGTGGTDYGWQVGRSPQTGGVINDGFYIYDIKTNNAPFAIRLGGDVGIGTTNPVTKLNLKESNSGTEGLIITNWNNVNTLFLGSDSSSGGGKITLKTNAGTSNVFISSYSDSYLNGGNVGIGTTNPLTRLHAYIVPATSSSVDDILRLTSKFESVGNAASAAEGSGPAIVFSGGIGDNQTRDRARIVAVYEGSNVSGLAFHTQNTADIITEKVRFQNNGKVGIGTTNPAYTLDVSGSGRFNGTGTNGYVYISGNAGGGGSTNPDHRQGMNFSWNKSNGGGESLITYADAGGGSNIRFGVAYWNNTTYSEQFSIVSSGNVGIGTVSPAAKLEVNGNIKLSSTAGSTATPSNIWLGNDYSNGTTRDKLKVYLYNSGTEQYGFSVGAIADVQYHSNVFHDFYTANSLSVRINGSGNVGIGTTSPGTLLHLVQSSGPTIRLVRTSNRFDITADNDFMELNARDASTYMTFRTADTERMRITSAGNVGIGTTSPSQKLSVVGDFAIANTTSIQESRIGKYQSGSLGSGTHTIASISVTNVDAVFFDYVIKNSTTDLRAGTVMAVTNGSTVEYTDISTADIGDTSRITMISDVSGGNIRLRASIDTGSGSWTVRTLLRTI